MMLFWSRREAQMPPFREHEPVQGFLAAPVGLCLSAQGILVVIETVASRLVGVVTSAK